MTAQTYSTAAVPVGSLMQTISSTYNLEQYRLSEEAYRELKERRAHEEATYCRRCTDLKKCQFSSPGFRYDEATNTYHECNLHRDLALKAKLKQAFEQSALPKRYRNLNLDQSQQSKVNEILRERKTLIIKGGPRSGKTAFLSALGGNLIRAGHKALYRTCAEMLNDLRWNNEDYSTILKELTSIETLLIDDLGRERQTDYSEEQLMLVLSKRDREELVTIMSTREHNYSDPLEEWLHYLPHISI